MFEPTEEQNNIITTIKNMQDNETVIVIAFAGTGKTSTFYLTTHFLSQYTFLYLAFGKDIVKEGKKKFNSNVFVTTVNSLAFKAIVKDKKEVKEETYKVHEISEIFDCELNMAFDILQIVNFYCNSDFENISDVAYHISLRSKNVIEPFRLAQDFYNKMKKREIKITHNFYLKEYSLSDIPRTLNFDYILLDEAQDTNRVTLAILKKVSGKKILVGDPHQNIFTSFRGSVNAMEEVNANYKLYLSSTFRCNQNIVNYANEVLYTYKREKTPIISMNDRNDYKINTIAFITRTNAQIIFLISQFSDFQLIKEPDELFETTISIYNFLSKKPERIPDKHKYLNRFKNEDELLEHIYEFNDVELSTSFRIAKIFKGYLYVLRNKAKKNNNKNSKNILLTAHTSKGLEFDKVELQKDFKTLKKIKNVEELQEEANLLYVAITRAKYEIYFEKKGGFREYM